MIRKKLLTCILTSSLLFTAFTQCVFAETNLKLGAWPGAQPTVSNISDFQTLQQKKVDIVHTFIDWSTSFYSIKTCVDATYSNGSILMITWEPWGTDTVKIKNGDADSYIKQMANDIKSFGKEIWLRPLHEANGNWYPWAIGDSKVNTNETHIAAYRHIVDIFKAQGVTNVKWVFNVNCSNCGQGASFNGYYPGDAYVDYCSIDGYNWGTTQSWGSTWQSFDQIFSAPYNAIKQYNKPILIAEWSSAEKGGDKARWITDSFNTIKSSYDKIFATIWFNENKETDWRINSSSASLEAYKKAIGGGGFSLDKKGDVDSSGKVDILDATMLKSVIIKKKPVSILKSQSNADINGDGNINSLDYLLLLQLIKSSI